MRKLSAAVAALVVASPTAFPQAGTGRPKDPKREEVPVFDPTGPARKGERPSDASTPEHALAKALPLITTWPAEAGENALRALAARGPEMVPLLRARLASGTVLERAAAARGLMLLRDAESYPAIEKLFADPRQRTRFAPLLAGLADADAAHARELALRYLESEQAPLRTAARGLLRARADEATRSLLIDRLAGARSDGVRLDLFELLADLRDPRLPALGLERFLGARDPSLAAKVTTLLSWQDDAGVRAELARLAAGERERRNLHAALALALHEHRTGTPELDVQLFDHYLPMVRTSDLLLRQVACIVCGTIGYRRGEGEAAEQRAELTRTTVLPALADVVVNGRFFGDFEICFSSAVATLELLTGERLGRSVPAWREWLARNPSGLLEARRELQDLLLDTDAQEAIVRLSRADATGRLVIDTFLCGDRHRAAVAAGERPGALAPGSEAMRVLLLGLESAGFFAGELPRQLERVGAGDVELRVAARGRERVVALAAGDPLLRTVEVLVGAAAETSLWQLLLPPDETYARRFAEETAWYATHPDRDERRSRLVDLALAQASGEDAAGAAEALGLLARLDGLGSSVRATQIDSLAALLARLPAGDPRAQRLFDLLVATGRDDAFDRVADALAPRGAAAVEALADALLRMRRVEKGLDDARAAVRLAALLALEREAVALPEERLVALARTDGEERVRAKALALLAARGGEQGVALLLEQARAGPLALRSEALRRLGASRHEEALACLVEAANGDDPTLAAAALEGLAARGDEAAADALAVVVRERPAGDPLERLALAAIKSLPRAMAVVHLRRLLAEEQGPLGREAAYALADLGEMEAAPVLLADLEDERTHRRAQTMLTYLFCKDFGTETWRYRSMHEGAPGASHVDHFLGALRESGALLPDGRDVGDRAFQPVLVAALEDPRWFVRRSALELLEANHGRKLGSLPAQASAEEIDALAARWREWIGTQAAGGER